jgi:hypothetical protein
METKRVLKTQICVIRLVQLSNAGQCHIPYSKVLNDRIRKGIW